MMNGNDTFFINFLGKPVLIVTELQESITTVYDSHSTIETFPVIYKGILLSYDEENYYLGKDHKTIFQAVKRIKQVSIIIDEPSNPYEEVLANMPDPEKTEDVN